MTTLYSKQGCAPCLLVKRLFQNKGIEYIEKDIADETIRQELFERFQAITVPVVVINDEPVIGPNFPAIMQKLALA